MSVFKPCDIRGIFGDEWSESDAYRIGSSLGKMLGRRGQSELWIGGDFRHSTPAIKKALTGGLVNRGIGVHDIGQVPTPAVYFAARTNNVGNVAVVTASHNPGPYNGVKFMVAGRPAVPELISELESGLDDQTSRCEAGFARHHQIVASYEAWLLDQSRTLCQRTAGENTKTEPDRLRAVVDTMGGALTDIGPRVLARVGATVVSLSEIIDTNFATRAPNPADDANLDALVRHVRATGTDIGIAFDGDGDRVIFVDASGNIVRPEQVAALLMTHCYDQPTVVFDLKCASLVPRVVAASGGRPIMRPSGHGFIKSAMIDLRADLGVEVSGHHFYDILGGGDDAAFTALVVLRLLQNTGNSLAALIEPFPWPAITGDLRLPCSEDAELVVERIATACGGNNVSRLDGVRAEYDSGWALARASITEPAITFRFEGANRDELMVIASRFLSELPELREQVLEMIDD